MSLADEIDVAVPPAAAVVSHEEGRELLDAASRRKLGMSGQEFLEAWDAGRFADHDTLALHEVAALVPFAR